MILWKIMNTELGQSEEQLAELIKQVTSAKKLTGKKQKRATKILMSCISDNVTKGELSKGSIYRVQCNYSRIGRTVTRERFINRYESWYEDPLKESTYPAEEAEYKELITPEKEIQNKVVDRILKLYDDGLIQRLRTKSKDGIIDATFLLRSDDKKIGGEKDQVDFAKELSVSEWEDIFNQTTKLAKKQRLEVVPVLNIDKHFCEIFDIDKVRKFMPGLDGYGLKDAWDATLGSSISIMKQFLLETQSRKKQLGYLTLTIFCHEIIRLSNELIYDYLEIELLNLSKKDSLPETVEEIKQFRDEFNQKYRPYFTGTKKDFIDLYNIPEKTFYRRLKDNFFPFREQFFKGDEEGRRVVDVPNYFKNSYPKTPFGIPEEK